MTITLHEVGHHMGLNHHGPAGNSNGAGSSGCGPNLPEQVMYWSVGQGTLKRQLFLHDEMGAVAIYPNFVVDGLVRDASNNDPLYNAKVAFDEGTYAAYVGPVEFAVGRAMTPGEVYTTYPTPNSGDFFLAMNRGVFNFTVSKFGYESSQVYEVNMSTPTTYGDTRVEEFVIDLQPTVRGDVSGFLKDVLKDSALTGSVKLTWVGDENEVFEIAPEADGSFSIEVPSDEYYNVEISLEEPYDPVTYLDSVYIPAEGLELDLDIRPSNVLIVYDNDVTESMKEKYETKFNSLKIGHANWDISSKGISPSASTVSLYSEPLTIFWVAGGDTTSNLESDEINFLTSHLDAGNRLVLTGSNISEYIDSTSSLLPDYAGVKFKGNNSSFKINGITGDRIGDGISANLLGSGKDVVEFSTSQMGEVNQTLYFGTSIADSGNIAGVRSQNSEQGWKFVFFTESIDKILDTNLDTLIYRSIEYCLDSNFVNSVRIKNEDILANRYSISQNYPNPFNPSTTIKFALPVNAEVKLTIFNILGEQVEVLQSGLMNAGSYELQWNAVGSSMSSGIYFYHIEVNGVNGSRFAQTKKMILLK
jgi:hypothetical protein